MRRMIIVLVVLAMMLAMMLAIAMPLLADAGTWRGLASGGKWRGERDADAPGSLNLNLERKNCDAPWYSG